MATGPESITVSWDPPPTEAQNGIIISYTLSCQPESMAGNFPAMYSTAGNYSLDGFTPATTYNCSVFASTAGGTGPAALQTVTLLDDGIIIITLCTVLQSQEDLALIYSHNQSLPLNVTTCSSWTSGGIEAY